MSQPTKSIFTSIRYHLPSSWPEPRRNDLIKLIEANGGSPATDILDATHIITNTHQFERWKEVPEETAVVTHEWVERCVTLQKLQPTQFYSADPAMIFSGVVACATGIPSNDMDVMSAGITGLGGQWRIGLNRDVTHLFALGPGSDKYETAMHYQESTGIKVLLPHWFDDTIKLGTRLLPTAHYEWPEPGLLRPTPEDGKPHPEEERGRILDKYRQQLLKIARWSESDDVPQTKENRDVWHGKRILLSSTLDLMPTTRDAIISGTTRLGGKFVELHTRNGMGSLREESEKIEETDIYITRYRSGTAYAKAVRADKTIATITWLFHVEATGVMSSPRDQLLHYPIPRSPIDGFSQHQITISNYTGETREYIKKLIAVMGATFTPSMSAKNTVVIAAFLQGAKTEKAQAWSIPVVNHLWLEDCFVQWRALTVGVDKYINFPPRMDFSQVLATRGLGRRVLDDAELDLKDFDDEEAEVRGQDQGPSQDVEMDEDRPITVQKGTSKDVPKDISGDDEPGPSSGVPADDPRSAHDEMEIDEPPTASSPKKSPQSVRKPRSIDASKPGKGERKMANGLKRKATEALSSDTESEAEDVPPVAATKRKKLVRRSGTKFEVDLSTPKKDRNTDRKATSTNKISSDLSDDEANEDAEKEQPDSSSRRETPNVSKKTRAPSPLSLSEDEEDVARDDRTKPSKDTTLKPSSRSNRRGKDTTGAVAEETAIIASKSNKGKGGEKETRPESSTGSKSARKLERQSSQVSVVMPPLPVGAPTKVLEARAESVRIEKEHPASSPLSGNEGQISKQLSTVHIDEPEITSGRSKRSAATKATQKLRTEIVPDMLEYQQAMKKTGKARDKALDKGLEVPSQTPVSTTSSKKRRTSSAYEQEEENVTEERSSKKKGRGLEQKSTNKKVARPTSRNQMVVEDDPEEEEEEEENAAPAKDKRKGISREDSSVSKGKNSSQIKIMVTGCNLDDSTFKKLTKLGAMITSKPSECTHLVVSHIARTEKLLCAMAVAPYILPAKWVHDSIVAGHFLTEDDYPLQDPAGEKKFDFKLNEALERSKITGGRLLKHKTFYVTPKVKVDTSLLKNVITANGGTYSSQKPTVRILKADANRHVISCVEDAPIWEILHENGYPIFSPELILSGILKQDMDWDNTDYRVPGSI